MIWLILNCEYNLKLYLFADDAKLYCHIKDVSDIDNFQRGIDNFIIYNYAVSRKFNI